MKEIFYVLLVIAAAIAIITGIQWADRTRQEAQREAKMIEQLKEIDKDGKFSKHKDRKDTEE